MCSGNEFPPNGRNGFQRHLPFFPFFIQSSEEGIVVAIDASLFSYNQVKRV
jgi:hypothetical protein